MTGGDGWWRVVLPWACYGVRVGGGRVVWAAPIGRGWVGRPIGRLEGWVSARGGSVRPLRRGRTGGEAEKDPCVSG